MTHQNTFLYIPAMQTPSQKHPGAPTAGQEIPLESKDSSKD